LEGRNITPNFLHHIRVELVNWIQNYEKTNKKHRTSQFTNNQYQSNYQLKKSSCSDTLTQLDKLHAAATAQLDSITSFTSWLQQNCVNDSAAMKLRLCRVLNLCNS
jgi:predicted component of viral defense system (DUF524 family)